MSSSSGHRARATDGQFRFVIDHLPQPAKVVSTLMQTMEREAAAQFNDLGEFDQDEFSAARQSIKKVFIESFGDPTARTAPAIHRGKTSWHDFVADNFQNKKQKMSRDPENEGTLPICKSDTNSGRQDYR